MQHFVDRAALAVIVGDHCIPYACRNGSSVLWLAGCVCFKTNKIWWFFFFFATSSSIIAFTENVLSVFRTPVKIYRQLLLYGVAMVSWNIFTFCPTLTLLAKELHCNSMFAVRYIDLYAENLKSAGDLNLHTESPKSLKPAVCFTNLI